MNLQWRAEKYVQLMCQMSYLFAELLYEENHREIVNYPIDF